jgi:hypothetical protein
MVFNAIVGVAALASVVLASASAAAQTAVATSEQRTYFTEPVRAPSGATEVTLGTGYTRGFGGLRVGTKMSDVVKGGAGVELGLADRATPHFGWGVTGQYQELESVRSTGARGVSMGLDLTFHANPDGRVDPWFRIGPGYRLLWETRASSPALLSHGPEIVRALVGFDVRTEESVALAPVVGGHVGLFLWQKSGAADTERIAQTRLSAFVFAGIQGRFDLGGARVYRRDQPVIFTGR